MYIFYQNALACNVWVCTKEATRTVHIIRKVCIFVFYEKIKIIVNCRKNKFLAGPGFELMTLAFEDQCSTTELRNPSYFLGQKMIEHTNIFFKNRLKNSGPSKEIGEKAL
jgi:hypothetical protein